ncbi:trypsin-like peptidase domain-containing protein [Streptomyces sp. NPDC058284]|uniref:S1C family serine protease n=1 Tax=unclassified Streptomyces TaxID=2593676 RepID=UPI0036681B14
MDEGKRKPTKANWWSRPRPEVRGADAGADAGEQLPGSDADTDAGERLPGSDPDQAAGPGPDPASDVEPTSAPAAPAEATYTTQAQPPHPDPALPPHPDAATGQMPTQAPTAPMPDADVPTQAPAAPATPAPAPHGTTPHGVTSGASISAASSAAQGPPVQDCAPVGQGPAPVERPRPLHDPDPYGTPPYGEPGPWAPAPPVQRPTATPAQGTALPAPPYSGTPTQSAPPHAAPFPAPPYGGTPEPSAPAPAPGGPAPYNAANRPAYDPWNAPLQQIGSLPPESAEKRSRRGKRVLVVGAAVIALVSSLIGGAVGSYLERNGSGDIELRQPDTESVNRPRGSVAGIASASLPGVVTLHVSGDSAQGTGTGFVLDAKGHILTNNHVVEPAGTGGEVTVTFSGGETAKAEVVGRDSGYDLAVVKVSHVSGLKPLPLGNSENVQVGDPVVAIGAPFDLENTVTSGIISAKERPITAGGEKGDGSDISYVDALQTDAPINPGNSGGPLVDSKARVIGINSAIRSADEGSDPSGGQAGSIGLGFAIPINQGKRVAEELINFGRAAHPVIGVTLDTQFTGDGARIADKGRNGGLAVNKNGPGDKAGLVPGDVITEVDGRAVHSSDELIVKVRAHRPKDRLRLTVERGGGDREVTLVLGSADGD